MTWLWWAISILHLLALPCHSLSHFQTSLDMFWFLDLISKPFLPSIIEFFFCCILVDLEQFLICLELFGCLSYSFWFLNEWSVVDDLSFSVCRYEKRIILFFIVRIHIFLKRKTTPSPPDPPCLCMNSQVFSRIVFDVDI